MSDNVRQLRVLPQAGDVVTMGENTAEAVIAEVEGDRARLAFFDPLGRYYREWVPLLSLRKVR